MKTVKVHIRLKTTWVLNMLRLFCWLKIKSLIMKLDGLVIYRIYANGKLRKEIALNLKNYERQANHIQ